jgi:hypothetical protein
MSDGTYKYTHIFALDYIIPACRFLIRFLIYFFTYIYKTDCVLIILKCSSKNNLGVQEQYVLDNLNANYYV